MDDCSHWGSVDATLVNDACSFAPEGVPSNECPSSEWAAIQQFLTFEKNNLPKDYIETYQDISNLRAIEIFGKNSQRQLYSVEGSGTEGLIVHMATTQQAATADAFTATSSLWFLGLDNATARPGHGSPLSHQSDSTHTLTGDNYQPFTIGTCQPDVIRSDTDSHPIAFPILLAANDLATANTNITRPDNSTIPAIIYPNISRAEMLSSPRNASRYQLQWIDLPQPLFNGSSIGAIILMPQLTSNSTVSQDIILCNLAAGWGTTTLQMEQFDGTAGTVSSQIANFVFDALPDSNIPRNVVSESSNNVVFWQAGQFPQRHINITREWAYYLNPIVRSVNSTVFDLIMQESLVLQASQSSVTSLAASYVLQALLNNGLARIGFESTLQGSPKSLPSTDGTSWIDSDYWLSGKGNVFEDPTQSRDWVKLHVNSTLQGYAYNTQTVAPRIAIGIMILYCIIAVAHLLYSGISGTYRVS